MRSQEEEGVEVVEEEEKEEEKEEGTLKERRWKVSPTEEEEIKDEGG